MIKYEFLEDETVIINSYKLTNYEIKNVVVPEIIYYRLKKYLPVNRTNKSYEREIKAHNRLYKLGLYKEHTKDCNLEEPIKWYYELLYFIIGW